MTADGLAVPPPTKYEEDDTPRRFKDLMRPAAEKKPTNTAAPKNKADDVWTVRPGETFRDFNRRIREAGLTVPPGVPETIRAGAGVGVNKQVKRPLPASEEAQDDSKLDESEAYHRLPKQPKKHTTSLSASVSASAYPPKRVVIEEAMPGEKTKMKKKKYLKERKLASKKGRPNRDGDGDQVRRDQKMQHHRQPPKFRQVVQAPPALRTVPKATLKMRSQKGGPRPSLLPLVKKRET